MRRNSKCLAVVAVILWAGAWTVTRGQAPRPGTLDPTFGKGGVAAIDLSSHWITKLATQDVTLGSGATEERIVATSGTSWVLARHLPNGSLDTSFGVGGVVTKTFRKGSGNLGGGVVAQPDGKLVVAGSVPTGKNAITTLAVARYNADGTDDTSFGTGGLAAIALSPYASWPNDVALQSDGKIVVVGRANTFEGLGYLFAVRLSPDGLLDEAFGTGGVFTYSHPSSGRMLTTAYSVAVQKDQAGDPSNERIVVTATGQESSAPYLAVTLVMRLTPNGGLDQDFGSGGMTRTAVPDAEETHVDDMAIDGDNRIVAAGKAYYNLDSQVTGNLFIARYLEDGRPDSLFGSDGVAIQSSWDDPLVDGIAIQPNDGKILVAGSVAAQDQGLAAVWRFSPYGNPDPTFGTNGLVTRSSASFLGITLVHKPDGTNKFLVGGRVSNPKNNKSYWTLWRYFY